MKQELVIRNAGDVSNFIDEQPGGRSTFLIVLIALGGVFVDAYDFTSLGIGVPALTKAFGLSPLEIGSVTAMMAIGAFIGAIWGGKATDKVGRYKMFLVDLVLLVAAALGAAFSVNLPMLLVFRFLLGLGVGLDFPVALSFIAEFVNKRKRGAGVNLWQLMWYVAASCTGLIVIPFYFAGFGENLWRVAVGFGAFPALLILILRFRYVKESAPWAAQNLGLAEAARILEATYKIRTRVVQDATQRSPQPKEQATFGEIFTTRFIKRTILVSVICATQSLEYFAIGFNLPSISQALFGKEFINAILGAIAFNVFGIAGALLGVAVTKRMGARRMAIVGYVVVLLSLLALFKLHDTLPLGYLGVLIGLMIFGHAFGPGAQGMTMAALSYPTRIRGVGTGWGQGMVRVGSITGFYFFPILVASVGFYNMIGILMLAPALGLAAALLIKWEPVGAGIEESDEQGSAGAVVERNA
ncbi:MAG: MFS transporter [Paraburkholderia sp.]|jgi:MFS family permease|nr:MFS transporter [Paraburkholderia sp.]